MSKRKCTNKKCTTPEAEQKFYKITDFHCKECVKRDNRTREAKKRKERSYFPF